MTPKRKKRADNLLDIVFRISDAFSYEVDEDGIVTVEEKQDHKIQRFLRKLKIDIPEQKWVTLDEIGSFVFRQIDGRKTVREIGEALETQYGESVQPLYERLSLYLSQVEKQCHYIERVEP